MAIKICGRIEIGLSAKEQNGETRRGSRLGEGGREIVTGQTRIRMHSSTDKRYYVKYNSSLKSPRFT